MPLYEDDCSLVYGCYCPSSLNWTKKDRDFKLNFTFLQLVFKHIHRDTWIFLNEQAHLIMGFSRAYKVLGTFSGDKLTAELNK
ncbi:hypothetical protein PsB1_0786 [Candidatus Phycosocius spiralis]|uniref:Uncharacterized protein n=1 Tax=Candidatus Phycosocius spiralis TaxID=2815099 RepID=A0ABQ4PUC8_9PROT|nr:hypothetical protein PsB1_0786 [Candidatus Phycosocius spiralis]